MFTKVTVTFVTTFSLFALAGCSSEPAATESEESQSQQVESTVEEATEESGQGIEVEEGFASVEVTLPAEFYEDLSDAEIAQSVDEEGYSNFTRNADGSVTFEIPKDVHEQGLVEMKEELDASIQEAVNQAPEVFKSVTYDDAVTEFEIVVDKAAYESNMEAQWIGFGLNFQAMFYQAFAGVSESDRGGAVNLIDEATGDVFDSQQWPAE